MQAKVQVSTFKQNNDFNFMLAQGPAHGKKKSCYFMLELALP